MAQEKDSLDLWADPAALRKAADEIRIFKSELGGTTADDEAEGVGARVGGLRLFIVPGPRGTRRVLKIRRVDPEEDDKELEMESLAREAAAVSRLQKESVHNHNLVRIFDAGLEMGADGPEEVRILMEYIDGVELTLFWGLVLPLRLVLTWMKGVAGALLVMHEHHLLHLDVKPQNVLIDCKDVERAVLFDFDTTCATRVNLSELETFGCTDRNLGLSAISPTTSSPEQQRLAEEYDTDSDSGSEAASPPDSDAESETEEDDDATSFSFEWDRSEHGDTGDEDDWWAETSDDESNAGSDDEEETTAGDTDEKTEEETEPWMPKEESASFKSASSELARIMSESSSERRWGSSSITPLEESSSGSLGKDGSVSVNESWRASDVYSLGKTFRKLLQPNDGFRSDVRPLPNFDIAKIAKRAQKVQAFQEEKGLVLEKADVDLDKLLRDMTDEGQHSRPSLDEVVELLDKAMQVLPLLTKERLAVARDRCEPKFAP